MKIFSKGKFVITTKCIYYKELSLRGEDGNNALESGKRGDDIGESLFGKRSCNGEAECLLFREEKLNRKGVAILLRDNANSHDAKIKWRELQQLILFKLSHHSYTVIVNI